MDDTEEITRNIETGVTEMKKITGNRRDCGRWINSFSAVRQKEWRNKKGHDNLKAHLYKTASYTVQIE